MMELSKISESLKFYTTQEVADLLKMNVQVISRKLASGEIAGYKIGKDWRIAEKDLIEWIEKHSNKRRGRNRADNVIDNFIKDGRVASLPAQRKKRRYVLEYILGNFNSGRVYTEKEVNEIISRFYDDFCTVRREFIAEKMMSRANGKYRRNSSYKSL